MATQPLPSPEELRQLLRYEPETGKLFWLPRDGATPQVNSRIAGKEAFTARNYAGYLVGSVNYVRMRAHRVIWAMVYGDWPDMHIDHINRVRDDNRLSNLRLASNTENQWNRGVQRNNRTGVKGVHFRSARKRWRASISHNNHRYELGEFATFEEAASAYREASVRLQGVYASDA